MDHHRTVIAVDLAETVFEIAISHTPGDVAETKRLSRTAFQGFFRDREPVTVAMEACGSAHYWARELQAFGHTVELIPPHLVRPYVTRNKTDRADAKGILEARRNTEIRSVPVKTLAQQVIGSIHRFRSGWIGARTAQVNTLRGLLRELGLIIPVGVEKVVPTVRLLVEGADSTVPDGLRPMLALACDEIESLNARIKQSERELETIAEASPVVARIRSIPGIGLLTGTALAAFVGDVKRFGSGRRFASYLGLTPRERSSGMKQRYGRISKRGDSYLRLLLIHGARSVLGHATRAKSNDSLRTWAVSLNKRTKYNKASVALANKLARIVWAVWSRDTVYRSEPVTA
jgi:transposase